MSAQETEGLARSGAIAGLCPTTEANLGDGIFPATGYLKARGALAIGSDSHITVSPAEDLRMLEYSQRLRERTRNALAGGPGQSTGASLFEAALTGGARSMRQPVGPIAPGRRCDIAVLDGDCKGDVYADTLIFPRVLIGQLRPNIGKKVLGRLGQGTAKPGQSAPWTLLASSDDDKATAVKYETHMAAKAVTPVDDAPF
jgi:cytosine/adenosine deaminase-related metal-dependent hydrolase